MYLLAMDKCLVLMVTQVMLAFIRIVAKECQLNYVTGDTRSEKTPNSLVKVISPVL